MTSRYTVANSVEWKGVGIHTGNQCIVRVHPSENGLEFKSGNVVFKASPYNVVDVSRCTAVGAAGIKIMTVEHLLAGLYCCGIASALIEIEGSEVPIGDGSARQYVDGLRQVGAAELEPKLYPKLKTELSVELDGKFAATYPQGHSLTGVIDFSHPLVGHQSGIFDLDPVNVDRNLASARTFGFDFEVEALRQAGLIQGGSIDNALIIGKDGFWSEPRYADEPLRHKMLDFIGDMMLVGTPLHGVSFTAVKTGHAINNALARKIYDALVKED